MDFDQITFAIHGTTAVVTLNRPERRNALSGKLLRELNAALLEADEHNAVHCVILRGKRLRVSQRAGPGLSPCHIKSR